jgi:hypothetical protein
VNDIREVGEQSVGAGITAVLASFGVTWKAIGEFFGRAAATGEAQLWDAELDWAIAYRFTVLRDANQLKTKWPDVDLTPEKVRPEPAATAAVR